MFVVNWVGTTKIGQWTYVFEFIYPSAYISKCSSLIKLEIIASKNILNIWTKYTDLLDNNFEPREVH